MRKGASRRPKCSRYMVIEFCRLVPRPRSRRVGRIESSTPSRGFETAVKRGARDAEELRGLGHVALRDFERGVEIRLLDALQDTVEAEGLSGKEVRARPGGEPVRRRVGGGGELGFEVAFAYLVAGVLGGETDHDVLQLAHVAGKAVGEPTRRRRAVELEGAAAALVRVEDPVIVEQALLVVAE